MRTYYKQHKSRRGQETKFGVEDEGRYVTNVPGRLIWLLHNSPQWIHKVGQGYNFNVLQVPGSSHEFIPDYAVPKGRAYLERLGQGSDPFDLAELNRHNGVFELKIWDCDGPLSYAALCAPPIPGG